MAKKTKKRQYKVLVVSNARVNGVFYTKGNTVVVPKEYYDRVVTEKDCQLKAL